MGKVLTLHDPATAAAYCAGGWWGSETLYACVCRHALERPDAFALRDTQHRLTWSDVRRWADAIADDLVETGLAPGERVALWLPSRVEAVVTTLACSRAGLVVVPSLHKRHTLAGVVDLLGHIGTSALLVQPGYAVEASDLTDLARGLGHECRIYDVDRSGSDGTTAFPALPKDDNTSLAPQWDNPDSVVYLAFTSGTTGRAKAVMHSDNTLLANGRAMVADWHVGPDSVIFSISPTSHHIATVGLEQALIAGCELVLYDPAADGPALDRILATGATYVMGVPTHAIDVLAAAKARGLSRLGQVDAFYMAGATIPQEVASGLMSLGAKPQNVYGMTENGSHNYTRPEDPLDVMIETCGQPCAGYEIRIWRQDDPDTEVAPNTVGEIGSRGANLMLGYFADQRATETSFNRHGWFLSGDLGRIDKNGNLHVVGRKKDLIIRGGENIYPGRIEDLAIRHPAIISAAVVPVPDPRLGERICLTVLLDDNATAPSGDDVLDHLKSMGLAVFELPEYFAALDAYPLTASGKILKRELVSWIADGALSPEPIGRLADTTASTEAAD